MNKVPYLMHADALKLKECAEALMYGNRLAHISLSCSALLSLIEQAHSPQLGLATTKELRTEYKCRMNGDEISRADDYRTFDATQPGSDKVARPEGEPDEIAATVRVFIGWLSGDIPELNKVEVPRLAESWERFQAEQAIKSGVQS